MEQEVKKFSEEYKSEKFDFEGERCELTDILDKEIIIHNFAKMSGKFGEFVVVDAEVELNKKVQFIVGSSIILTQLEKIKADNNFPIKTTITKRHSESSKRNYYTLS